jgi:hypothetical protein
MPRKKPAKQNKVSFERVDSNTVCCFTIFLQINRNSLERISSNNFGFGIKSKIA